MKYICEFLRTNRYVFNIDISWNTIQPDHWKEFLQLLSEDKRLRSVNICWNNIVPHESDHRMKKLK